MGSITRGTKPKKQPHQGRSKAVRVLAILLALLLLVPLAVFLVDAGFTLSSRMLSGQRWMEPHTQHVYQRAVKAGFSHARVTGVYILLGLIGAVLLYAARSISSLHQAGVAVAWGVLLACLWGVSRVRLRNF